LADSRYGEEDILSVIQHLSAHGGKKFSIGQLEASRSVYGKGTEGCWDARTLIGHREVLVLGTGPSVYRHRKAIENFINERNPFVIALNTLSAIACDLIDVRLACHPVSLLADAHKHLNSPQPLVAPFSSLPEELKAELATKKIHDFGMSVEAGTFSYSASGCVIPTPLVIAYALAFAAGGEASSIVLAGFDGYPAGDPRNTEMEKLLSAYGNISEAPSLVSITPSTYNLQLTSVYALEV
jgi:4-hydroxy 2-oxovalerate aldolase